MTRDVHILRAPEVGAAEAAEELFLVSAAANPAAAESVPDAVDEAEGVELAFATMDAMPSIVTVAELAAYEVEELSANGVEDVAVNVPTLEFESDTDAVMLEFFTLSM